MTDREPRRGRSAQLALLVLTVTNVGLAGCATPYMDQAKVPGSNQRIAVGHDGWPFRKAWAHDGTKWHTVKIVRRDK